MKQMNDSFACWAFSRHSSNCVVQGNELSKWALETQVVGIKQILKDMQSIVFCWESKVLHGLYELMGAYVVI